MACWQRSRQLTQPPTAARLRRVHRKAADAIAAATAAPPAATVIATMSAAVSKK
jgi:hypothetical protein